MSSNTVTIRHLWFFTQPDVILYYHSWLVPLCCLMQKICGFRWNFTYIQSAMSCLSVPVSRQQFDFRLNSHRIVHGTMLLYQQQGLQHPLKQTQQRWICFQRWFTPLESIFTKFRTFSPTNHPPHLHFRWRNSITGWGLDYFENLKRKWDIQEKRGLQLLHPARCSRVNYRPGLNECACSETIARRVSCSSWHDYFIWI